MPSPFPGMDPFVESEWSDFHTRLATYMCDALNPHLPKPLLARVEEYLAVEADDDSDRFSSDIRVVEQSNRNGDGGTAVAEYVALAEPLIVPTDFSTRTLRSVRIIDPKSEHRVITAIEILSPANKIGRAGRDAYERKRLELLDGKVNLVEIDLIRAGMHVLTVPYDQFPKAYAEPYRICIVRASARHQGEIYPAGFRQRLPAIRIPLRPSDADVRLDLQALVDEAYDKGRYGESIDYSTQPTPRLSAADAQWADEILKAKGLR